MVEILGVLRRLNICWKEIGNYNIRCKCIPSFWSSLQNKLTPDLRCDPNDASSSRDVDIVDPRSQNAIKFEIQVTNCNLSAKYILEFKLCFNLQGDPLAFSAATHKNGFIEWLARHVILQAIFQKKNIN